MYNIFSCLLFTGGQETDTMGPQCTVLWTLVVVSHLYLVSSYNATVSPSQPGSPESACPELCRCAQDVNNLMDITCSLASQVDWSETCEAVALLCDDGQVEVRLKLSGLGDTFSAGFGCLPRLNDLDLSETSLKLTPHMFRGLEIDGSLNLGSNDIENLPIDTFSGIVAVDRLDLSYNRLSKLNSSSFVGLEDIRGLDLSYNNISVIQFGSLSNMSWLESLDLASNSLKVFSFKQLSPNISLDYLSLKNNYLTSLYLGSNKTEAVPFHKDSQFDISDNLIECSCSLAYFLQDLPFSETSLLNVQNTLCDSPENLRGQSIALLDSSGLVCTSPEIFMSYPLKQKDLLTTSSITLECHANGFPPPSILWITPWGDYFLHNQADSPSNIPRQNLDIGSKEIRTQRKYREPNVLMVTSIEADSSGHLIISKIRGSMHGNYTCLAFNPAGNASKLMDLNLYCGLGSTYTFSLILGGYCASGVLILGFLVGFIKMLVVWLRHKLYFIVPSFSKATSTVAGGPNPDICSSSVGNSVSVNPRSGDGGGSITTCPHSPASLSFIEEENFSDDELDGQASGISAAAARQNSFRNTIEEAKGRWRDGVERKMELVRKNVQHIRESGSNYVHNIRESSSSAASRMKAGVALGVETVKYQLQSFKELCGTGDMGTNTISTISVQTDVDSHQQSEVVKQITFV